MVAPLCFLRRVLLMYRADYPDTGNDQPGRISKNVNSGLTCQFRGIAISLVAFNAFGNGNDVREHDPVTILSIEAGARLREIRLKQGFTLQQVEELGSKIAAAFNNPEFALPMSRLSYIETKGVLPSVHRVHALARIYRLDPKTIFAWYGIDSEALDALDLGESPRGRFAFFNAAPRVTVPVEFDPALDLRVSADLARMIEAWGDIPFGLLKRYRNREFLYGYVGTDDFMMAPILPPGSFVQVDPGRTSVRKGGWSTDYERPIYAVETRGGIYFCWCATVDRKLVLQPHPLSPAEIKIFTFDEAEILGQVVGAAIRVGSSSSSTKTER